MSTNLSQAQATQQGNRTQDGKYTFGTHAEPADVALEVPEGPILLESGDDTEIEADGRVFGTIVLQNIEGQYSAVGTPYYLDLADLLDATDDQREPTEKFDEVITHERQAAINNFVTNRYGNTEIVDSGSEAHLMSIDVMKSYDSAPTEQQVIDDLWPTGATIANETDPGTYGSEFLGRLLKDDLDKHAFSTRYPIAYKDGWLGEAPASMSDVMDEETAWMEDNSKFMSDKAVIAQAQHAGTFDSDMAEFARTGFMERERLTAAAKNLGFDAMAAWVNQQPTTSELLKEDHDD